jgi:glutamate 5-kinase
MTVPGGRALVEGGRSLLAAGVVSAQGAFDAEDAVEVLDTAGVLVAKGLVRCPSARAAEWVGRRSDQLPDGLVAEVIHRDDMVVLGE